MKQTKISDAELVLMEHIWEKEGIRAAQLVQLEKEEMGWSRNTTYTLLTRMVEKSSGGRIQGFAAWRWSAKNRCAQATPVR